MDLTSYLMGKKASGGGSSNNVVIANMNNGALDIKPSDVLDSNGNFKNKYYVVNSSYENTITFAILTYYEKVSNNYVNLIFSSFQEGQVFSLTFTASISQDNYFTAQIPNS